MLLDLLAGPGHGHRIEGKTGGAQDEERRTHRQVAEHRQGAQDDHQHLQPQYRQATEPVCQTAGRPLPQDAGAHHDRHPVADTGITHPLMVQVERHQAIERPQHYAGDDAAIDPKARLTQAQHGPHPGCPLLLALLVDNAGKEQRQDGGQYQASHPGQHIHQTGRQRADQQLPEHSPHVIDHHVGGEQAPPVARVAAAHQRTLNHHPDHGAADAGDESPDKPAPEPQGEPKPDTGCGKEG
ncbi:hypothetical protein D3C75_848780 [compost metagenome]